MSPIATDELVACHTTTDAVATHLGTDPVGGMDPRQVEVARNRHGANVLTEAAGTPPWRILWQQFTATPVLILIAASALSAYLGKTMEAVAILAIVVLFGLLGFFQECRAERAIAALKAIAYAHLAFSFDAVSG